MSGGHRVWSVMPLTTFPIALAVTFFLVLYLLAPQTFVYTAPQASEGSITQAYLTQGYDMAQSQVRARTGVEQRLCRGDQACLVAE
jgi:hypothetical protein